MSDLAVEQLTGLISTVVAEESDCLGINLHRDPKDVESLLLYELWTSEAAYFGDHMHTPHLLDFRERAVQFLDGPPEITVWDTLAELS
jgi:quinol monooxygenase YgiN